MTRRGYKNARNDMDNGNGMERVLLQSMVDQVGGVKLAESGFKKEL